MVFVKTHDIAELTSELIGKEVVLGGWIEDLRKLGKMSFITLRDVSGISQIIVKGELNDNLGEINRQSVASVQGIVQETKARDFDFEVKAEAIEILGKAIHPLPIGPIVICSLYSCGLCARYAVFPKYSSENRFAPPSLALPIILGVVISRNFFSAKVFRNDCKT